MRKKIRFFRQHTMETCGISCILMLLDYYRKVQYPTAKQEGKLYAKYRTRAFKGVTGAAAADCLGKNDLQVRLIHSSREYMDNRDDYFDRELYYGILAEYKQVVSACGENVAVQTGVDFDCDDLRTYLREGNQIMVQCIVPGDADGIHDHVLHWVLVYGTDGKDFLVCDPLSSKIRLSEAALNHYMDTPTGKICVVAGAKK